MTKITKLRRRSEHTVPLITKKLPSVNEETSSLHCSDWVHQPHSRVIQKIPPCRSDVVERGKCHDVDWAEGHEQQFPSFRSGVIGRQRGHDGKQAQRHENL